MIDISSITTGLDMGISNTQAPRAANILSVQIGALEYAQELGIDLKYFLQENLRFENSSFISYLVQILASNGIDIASVQQVIQGLFMDLKINVKADDNTTALVAR